MTLKCIAGIETPDKGRIVLEDGTREKKSLSRYNKLLLLTTFTSGIMAFLGAFLATMIFG